LLAFNGNFVREHPDLAKAYARAMSKAVEWVNNNKEEAVQIMIDKKYIPGTYADNLKLLKTYTYASGYTRAFNSAYNSVNVYTKYGVINPVKDVDAFVKSIFIVWNDVDDGANTNRLSDF